MGRYHTVDVEVDISDFLDDMEICDVLEWFNGLSTKEKHECFIEISDHIGEPNPDDVETALDTLVEHWTKSPYDKMRIEDRLRDEKII
jgi:hypothetical protein